MRLEVFTSKPLLYNAAVGNLQDQFINFMVENKVQAEDVVAMSQSVVDNNELGYVISLWVLLK